jgi:large subunit ribosomal protein L5
MKKENSKSIKTEKKTKKTVSPKTKIKAKVEETSKKAPKKESKSTLETTIKREPIAKANKSNIPSKKQEILKVMFATGKFKNIMEVPTLHKIVINVGAGKAIGNSNYITSVVDALKLISGQKPVITKAKVSESNFKIRKGAPIGVKVTLRNKRMYDFLERLNSFSLPRVRDFEGLSYKSFDGRGNYTFGVKEHLIFHEIDFDKVTDVIGMDITFVTTSRDNDGAEMLLRNLGLPLKERKNG